MKRGFISLCMRYSNFIISLSWPLFVCVSFSLQSFPGMKCEYIMYNEAASGNSLRFAERVMIIKARVLDASSSSACLKVTSNFISLQYRVSGTWYTVCTVLRERLSQPRKSDKFHDFYVRSSSDPGMRVCICVWTCMRTPSVSPRKCASERERKKTLGAYFCFLLQSL